MEKYHYWVDLEDGQGLRLITREEANKIEEENKNLLDSGKPEEWVKIHFIIKTKAGES